MTPEVFIQRDRGQRRPTSWATLRRPASATAEGRPVQAGTDMLFEMIPAHPEFFGASAPGRLRAVAPLRY